MYSTYVQIFNYLTLKNTVKIEPKYYFHEKITSPYKSEFFALKAQFWNQPKIKDWKSKNLKIDSPNFQINSLPFSDILLIHTLLSWIYEN
jgi:hypothetical protein